MKLLFGVDHSVRVQNQTLLWKLKATIT
jgi:hypothetical protein